MKYEINTKYGIKELDITGISIVIAHNGYGKTTLTNELVKKFSNNFELPLLESFSIKKNKNSFYITNGMSNIKYNAKEVAKLINSYKSTALEMEISDKKLDELFELILKTFSSPEEKTNLSYYLKNETFVKLENLTKINYLLLNINDQLLEKEYVDQIIRTLCDWGGFMDTKEISQDDDYTINTDFSISWDESFYPKICIDEIQKNLDDAEIKLRDLSDFLNEFSNESACKVDNDVLNEVFHKVVVEIFQNKNDWSRDFDKRNTLYNLIFPNLFPIINNLNEVFNSLITFNTNNFSELKKFISQSPVLNVKINGSKKIPIIEYSQLSTGEKKWIKNIINVVNNSVSNKILVLDDPLDSMDIFYSNIFMDMLKHYKKTYFVLTHKSDVLRYGLESKDFSFFNFKLEKIDLTKARYISNKSIFDIIDTLDWEEVLLFLIFFRFIFKNNKHTIYSILSKIAENINAYDVSIFEPLIIELSGQNKWRSKFSKHQNIILGDAINNKKDKSFEYLILEKFVPKSNDRYLKAMRHITETEPLDLYLFDSNKI